MPRERRRHCTREITSLESASVNPGLRIRPIVDIRPTSKGELRIDAAFPGAEVGGIPACPKSPDAWSQQKSQAGGAARR